MLKQKILIIAILIILLMSCENVSDTKFQTVFLQLNNMESSVKRGYLDELENTKIKWTGFIGYVQPVIVNNEDLIQVRLVPDPEQIGKSFPLLVVFCEDRQIVSGFRRSCEALNRSIN